VLVTAGIGLRCANTTRPDNGCEPGSYRCDGYTALVCVADGSGYRVEQDCSKKQKICTAVGCRVCEPGPDLLLWRQALALQRRWQRLSRDAGAGL